MIKANRNVYHISKEALGNFVGKTLYDFVYSSGEPVWIVEVHDVDKSIKIEYIYASLSGGGFYLANKHNKPLIEEFISVTSVNSSVVSSRVVTSKCCDCGAIHTSFPNNHYNWCSVRS